MNANARQNVSVSVFISVIVALVTIESAIMGWGFAVLNQRDNQISERYEALSSQERGYVTAQLEALDTEIAASQRVVNQRIDQTTEATAKSVTRIWDRLEAQDKNIQSVDNSLARLETSNQYIIRILDDLARKYEQQRDTSPNNPSPRGQNP